MRRYEAFVRKRVEVDHALQWLNDGSAWALTNSRIYIHIA